MPHTELHKKKFKKNLFILAAIAAWCAVIWGITMIRMANAAEPDISNAFKQERQEHMEYIQKEHKSWDKDREQAAKRNADAKNFEKQREDHLKSLYDGSTASKK